MARLFIAIDLPPALRTELTTLPGRFEGARWVKPDAMHVTLRFLGGVEDIDTIRLALAHVDGRAFSQRVAGVGRFPLDPRRPPRVLWAGMTRPPLLIDLRRRIDDALKPLKLMPDDQPFSPHVTLARILRLNDAVANNVRRYIALNEQFRSEPFAVSGFSLYESSLTTDGPQYRLIQTLPLKN